MQGAVFRKIVRQPYTFTANSQQSDLCERALLQTQNPTSFTCPQLAPSLSAFQPTLHIKDRLIKSHRAHHAIPIHARFAHLQYSSPSNGSKENAETTTKVRSRLTLYTTPYVPSLMRLIFSNSSTPLHSCSMLYVLFSMLRGEGGRLPLRPSSSDSDVRSPDAPGRAARVLMACGAPLLSCAGSGSVSHRDLTPDAAREERWAGVETVRPGVVPQAVMVAGGDVWGGQGAGQCRYAER